MVKHETRKQARFTSQLTLLNIPSSSIEENIANLPPNGNKFTVQACEVRTAVFTESVV